MKMNTIFLKGIALVISAVFLSACTPALYDKTNARIDTVQTQTKDAENTQNSKTQPQPSVVVKDGLYVDSTAINLTTQPAWLKEKISLRGETLPFSFYSRSVVRSSGVLTQYQDGLDSSMPINMSYNGDVKGALDMLASKTGYVYTIEGNTINWKAFVTQTFSIAFMPGSSSYLVGKEKSGSTPTTSSASDTIVTEGNSASAQSQFSNMQGQLSVWKDLKDTVSTMLSSKGRVVVSESTASITVTDHASNVATIAAYIKDVNKELTKQVMIKVQVLQVTLNDGFANGINWNIVSKMFSSSDQFIFKGDFSQPISLTPVAGITSAVAGIQNSDATSSALINALSQQGRVSVTTEPTVITTNNQIASLNIGQQTGYLARQSSTLSDSGQTTTTDLTPGQVNSGLSLFLLPRIMDNKVYLQISSSLSTLDQMQKISSTATASSSSQIIQAPIISQKEFNQRSVITTGATLILAGFKQLTNEANNSAMFQINQLGGRGASIQNTQTIVLITPYILNDV